jgi:Uma2 family endonuclease
MAVMTLERPAANDETTTPGDERKLAEVLCSLHDQINPPEGYRVEIIEGNIVLSPSPLGKHALIVADIRRAITPTLPASLELMEHITLQEPERGRYEPDLGLWPRETLDTDTEWVFNGEACLFVLEVTSPKQEQRDYAKAAGYARSGIPIYLVIDRRKRACVLYTQPERDQYRELHETPFGMPVTLPLDTPVTIETTDF